MRTVPLLGDSIRLSYQPLVTKTLAGQEACAESVVEAVRPFLLKVENTGNEDQHASP